MPHTVHASSADWHVESLAHAPTCWPQSESRQLTHSYQWVQATSVQVHPPPEPPVPPDGARPPVPASPPPPADPIPPNPRAPPAPPPLPPPLLEHASPMAPLLPRLSPSLELQATTRNGAMAQVLSARSPRRPQVSMNPPEPSIGEAPSLVRRRMVPWREAPSVPAGMASTTGQHMMILWSERYRHNVRT